MAAELVSSGRPIDIYARVSQLKRNEKREPSTDGQVSVCRVRLIDLGLAEGNVPTEWPSQTEMAKSRDVSRQRIGQAGQDSRYRVRIFARARADQGQRTPDGSPRAFLQLRAHR